MTSFSQWRTSFVKSQTVRQVTWICGTEPVLIEEIVDAIKIQLAPKEWDFVPFVVGEGSEREIWAAANQTPLDGIGPRLVIVRGAERLKQTDRLINWIENRGHNPHSFLVFVSSQDRLPRIKLEGSKDKGELPDYLQAFGSKGHLIECLPFTQATAKHAVSWVEDKSGLTKMLAGFLLERANGDLRLVRDVCEKLDVLPGAASTNTLKLMLAEKARDSFANSLISLDKKTALLALQELPAGEYSRTLGLLDARLDLASMIHDMASNYQSPGEILRAAGSQAFLVRELTPYAKNYDSHRRISIRQNLAMADEQLRAGQTTAVMELLVALW